MSRPNVLIIHTDQLSWWTLGCYGGTVVDTPNIDRLAREGALFSNFFTNSAVCTPSRGCLVTGRYPHSHGAYRNNIPLNSDETTFAHVLGKHVIDLNTLYTLRPVCGPEVEGAAPRARHRGGGRRGRRPVLQIRTPPQAPDAPDRAGLLSVPILRIKGWYGTERQ